MGRVFFPTYSLNRFGVRDTDQRATLGAVAGERFPAEPTPRSAMTPTGPMLGAVMFDGDGPRSQLMWRGIISADPPNFPGPAQGWNWGFPDVNPMPVGPDVRPLEPMPAPRPLPLTPAPISSSGGGGSVSTPPTLPTAGGAQPISQQVGPTPTVTMPPRADTAIALISSGGGTQTPSTPAIVAPARSTNFVDGISAWLGGSTALFNYKVPNAVLAGVVVLGFAWLSSGSTGRKR